jgi:hypothetical protein
MHVMYHFCRYTDKIANDVINCSHANHRGFPGQGVTENLTCGGPGPGGPCYNAAGSQCVPGAAARGPGSQQFGVFPIPGPSGTGRGVTVLYVGIRYGSAPDGMKCHEFQYWDQLNFDAEGHVLPMHFNANVTLSID